MRFSFNVEVITNKSRDDASPSNLYPIIMKITDLKRSLRYRTSEVDLLRKVAHFYKVCHRPAFT